jgi:hypothetical protein
VAAFDNWLASHGVARSTPYLRIKHDGSMVHETTTLPTAVRNRIHHPETPTTRSPIATYATASNCFSR